MSQFVHLNNGHLEVGEVPFRHVGVNVRYLPYYGDVHGTTKEDIDTNLGIFSQMGAKVVRIFAANKRLSHSGAASRILSLADKASGYGMRLLVSLTDAYCSDRQPQGDEAYCSPTPSGYSLLNDDWYAGGYESNYLPWVRAVVGLLANHPGIFAWEIGNELKNESRPELIIPMSNRTVQEIRALDPNHLIATGHTGEWALLDEQQSRQWYEPFDIVQFHTYDGEFKNSHADLAHSMGKAHIVGEAGYTAQCGEGARGPRVSADLAWMDSVQSDGYYPWGAQAQARDIGDGDNIYGFDQYCHTDFGDIYSVLRDYAAGLPVVPAPTPPPTPVESNFPLFLIALLGGGILLAYLLRRGGLG